MLERLLDEIRRGETLETHALASRLGASPKLIAAMLDHLQGIGVIREYRDCSSSCRGCGLAESCSSKTSVRLWQTRTP